MTKDIAVSIIWDYMHMEHELKRAHVLFVLGSNDVRVAKHAAALYHAGYAPIIAISGDGTKHETSLLNNPYHGQTESEVLKAVCLENGVPESAILTEDKANNTGQNFEFMKPVLIANDIGVKTALIVQKPYMERRAYATGKVWWPDVDLICTSPNGSFAEYTKDTFDPDTIINIMLGDLERIKEYPARGFQIHQDIPPEVWEAFLFLVEQGYTKHLLAK